MQVIFLIDIDCFFASVEMATNNDLKNTHLPIVICNNNKYGVIQTCSYIARKFGIHSGMPLFIAKQKCKNMIIVEPNMRKYLYYQNKFIDILKSFSRAINIASIDECFLSIDFPNTRYNSVSHLANCIKKKIYNELKIECSIGASFTKYFAKIASKINKPNGFFYINHNNYERVISRIKIEDILYVGKKFANNLKNYGIHSAGDLINFSNKNLLSKKYGKIFIKLLNNLNGISDNFLLNDNFYNTKSISFSKSFEKNKTSKDKSKNELMILSVLLIDKLHNYYFLTKLVKVSIKFGTFRNPYKTKQKTLKVPTWNKKTLLKIIFSIFDKFNKYDDVKGVGVSFGMIYVYGKDYIKKADNDSIKQHINIILWKVNNEIKYEYIFLLSLLRNNKIK